MVSIIERTSLVEPTVDGFKLMLEMSDDITAISKIIADSKLQCRYFQHVRLYDDHSYFNLGNYPEWVSFANRHKDIMLESFIFHRELLSDRYNDQASCRHTAWSLINNEKVQSLFARSARRHHFDHGISLIYRHEYYTDIFHFATDVDNKNGEIVFLQNVYELKRFILYYLDAARKNISNAAAHRVELNPLSRSSSTTLVDNKQGSINYPIKRYFVGDNYLTHREVDCLLAYARGHSYRLIASLLNLSPLTVKKHLENARSKLNCSNMVELIVKAAKSGVIKIDEI